MNIFSSGQGREKVSVICHQTLGKIFRQDCDVHMRLEFSTTTLEMFLHFFSSGTWKNKVMVSNEQKIVASQKV